MGNTDFLTLSGALDRIENLRQELDALERELRSLMASSHAGDPESVASSEETCESPKEDPAEDKTSVVETVVDAPVDLSLADEEPIDIGIPDFEIGGGKTQETQAVLEEPRQMGAMPPEAAQPALADGNAGASGSEVDASQAKDIPEDLPEDLPEESHGAVGQDAASPDAVPMVAESLDETSAPEAMQQVEDKAIEEDLPEDKPTPREPKEVHSAEQPHKVKTVMESVKADKAVMDVMAERQAWRTDRPGSPIKNIVSAISLNDRVLLINVLFKEDPMLFQETISAFNAMGSLDEAVSYIKERFPDWNLNSESVYRLMMAVRRKLK